MTNQARLLGRMAVAIVLTITLAACAGVPTPSPHASMPDRLQQLTDSWRDRAGVAAVAIAVDPAGPARWELVSGVAEESATAPTRNSRFRIGSITKTFVAAVVMQLVEERQVELDTPVRVYSPHAPVPESVTLRHLLAHTSGIPDYARSDGFTDGLLADRQRRWATEELLDLVDGLGVAFAPGAGYSYSNTGYVLLGQVIESVTGRSWAQQVRRRILNPLGMDNTYVAGHEPVPGGVIAAYGDADNDGEEEAIEDGKAWPALETAEGPAGAIVSTATDVARFADALFRGRLVRDSTLRTMVAEHPHHPRNSNYGLGIEITRPDYQTKIWGHGGFIPGWRSVMWYIPDRDLTIVVLTNDSLANPPDLAELAMRAVDTEKVAS